MAKPSIDDSLCTACGICVDECPTSSLDLEDVAILARPADCNGDGVCADSCPNGAIKMED